MWKFSSQNNDVRLLAHVGPMKVLAKPRNLLIEKGMDALFHCGVHPGAEITWMKNGSNLLLDEYHIAGPLGTLKIIGAALSDASDYVCIAQNEAGMSAGTITLAIGGTVIFLYVMCIVGFMFT